MTENERRAQRFWKSAKAGEYTDDIESAIIDILTDALHYYTQEGESVSRAEIVRMAESAFDSFSAEIAACPECEGTGRITDDNARSRGPRHGSKCKACGGTGEKGGA